MQQEAQERSTCPLTEACEMPLHLGIPKVSASCEVANSEGARDWWTFGKLSFWIQLTCCAKCTVVPTTPGYKTFFEKYFTHIKEFGDSNHAASYHPVAGCLLQWLWFWRLRKPNDPTLMTQNTFLCKSLTQVWSSALLKIILKDAQSSHLKQFAPFHVFYSMQCTVRILHQCWQGTTGAAGGAGAIHVPTDGSM